MYLGSNPKFQGNGTACWQEVYGSNNKNAAAAAWSRMLRNAKAIAYMEQRQREIDMERVKLIAYERAEALRDVLRIQRLAMQRVNRGRIVRKVKIRDPETGEKTERREYTDVEGMLNPAEAIRATIEALRIQGKHPDQQVQGTGMRVSINIDTQWQDDSKEPIDVTQDAELDPHTTPLQSDGEPPPHSDHRAKGALTET